jgi:hypothetical protein
VTSSTSGDPRMTRTSTIGRDASFPMQKIRQSPRLDSVMSLTVCAGSGGLASRSKSPCKMAPVPGSVVPARAAFSRLRSGVSNDRL